MIQQTLLNSNVEQVFKINNLECHAKFDFNEREELTKWLNEKYFRQFVLIITTSFLLKDSCQEYICSSKFVENKDHWSIDVIILTIEK